MFEVVRMIRSTRLEPQRFEDVCYMNCWGKIDNEVFFRMSVPGINPN